MEEDFENRKWLYQENEKKGKEKENA
jgi:hypothetical protein